MQQLLLYILNELKFKAKKLSNFNAWDADDLIQDTVERVLITYEKLFRQKPANEQERLASAIMYRIFCDKYRIKTAKKALKQVELYDWLYDDLPAEEAPDYDVAKYWDFILNHPHKAAMECFLLFVHGYKNREIAEGIGVSVNNITSNCLRAKREIQKHFGIIPKEMYPRKKYLIPKKTKPAA